MYAQSNPCEAEQHLIKELLLDALKKHHLNDEHLHVESPLRANNNFMSFQSLLESVHSEDYDAQLEYFAKLIERNKGIEKDEEGKDDCLISDSDSRNTEVAV